MKSIKESRFYGLTDQIDFYIWKFNDRKTLSMEQKKHLAELRDTISVFGKRSEKWVKVSDLILSEC